MKPLALILISLWLSLPALAAAPKLNFLLITTDDMSCDSVGVYGCRLPDTTPQMDRLAAQSLRFLHAFVQVGNCMPSRNVMWSGRYPHTTRVEGFYQIKDPDYPHLTDLMQAAGYFTGIRGKVPHSTPYHPYPAWDAILDTLPDGKPAHPKDLTSYFLSTQAGIAQAKAAQKPFCLNLNISDPHKPFYAEGGKPDPHVPSRVFTADEVPVPGFLFDDPAVRTELAEYYSSVRRADDCLGQILRALEESGEDQNTVILFLSDHGMPLPFAKTQLYYHSTRTPLMIRWPGVTLPSSVDDSHLVSAVDLLPTLLDIAQIPHPAGFEGRSFAPILRGEKQTDRDFIVAEYNENAGGDRSPMRSIITRDFAYLFNPWSNGERIMKTATQGTVTYRRMKALAADHPEIAARLHLFDHRLPEELYHYHYDDAALTNLIGKPEHQTAQNQLTQKLESWMVQTKDPLLEVFRNRHDPAARDAFMQSASQQASQRKSTPAKGKGKGKSGPQATRTVAPKGDHLTLNHPASATLGTAFTVRVTHTLHDDFGPQKLQVTLKQSDNTRIERQIVEIQGNAIAEVTFQLPPTLVSSAIVVAAFIGEDIRSALQHLQSKPIPIKASSSPTGGTKNSEQ
jgi:N-sulfoglucosamine sulfohydrolase